MSDQHWISEPSKHINAQRDSDIQEGQFKKESNKTKPLRASVSRVAV